MLIEVPKDKYIEAINEFRKKNPRKQGTRSNKSG